MKLERYSVERIITAVKQHEAGDTVADICRKLGIAEGTFDHWKKDYGGLEPDQLRELRQLCEENKRLKRIVADLSLDKAILQKVAVQKW